MLTQHRRQETIGWQVGRGSDHSSGPARQAERPAPTVDVFLKQMWVQMTRKNLKHVGCPTYDAERAADSNSRWRWTAQKVHQAVPNNACSSPGRCL